jgi:hypothetical protein
LNQSLENFHQVMVQKTISIQNCRIIVRSTIIQQPKTNS